MVFLVKGTLTYKCRVTAPDGRSAELSTGCRSKPDADEVEAVVRRWEGEKEKKHARPALVVALVEKRISLVAAFDASLDGRIDQLLSEAPTEPAPKAARDITEFVSEWEAWKGTQRRGKNAIVYYAKQLKALYPEIEAGKLTLAHFTKVEIAKRLDALKVQAPTKNRYKIPVSSFAKFLVRRGILETNIVRDIEGQSENVARMVYYERPEAQRLIFGLHDPIAGVAAFGCGFCMEWGAIAATMARDVSLVKGDEQVYVRGTKTKNRLRRVRLVEENGWLVPVLQAAVANKAPNAKLFPGLSKWVALKQQQKVARDLKIVAVGEAEFSQHNLHDWRSTHTVQLLRDRYAPAVASSHLGHANVGLVYSRYGLFIITREDYERPAKPATTDSTTTPELTLLRDAK